MAIFNFTKNSAKEVFFKFTNRQLLSSKYEKNSCIVDQLSDADLLLLNGRVVEISYISDFHKFRITKIGLVMAVLIPFNKNEVSRSILFLPNGDSDPEYYDHVVEVKVLH